MLKKLSAAILTLAVMAAANASVFASNNNGGDEDKKPVKPAKSTPAKPTEHKDWRAIVAANREKPFDPASRKTTLAEHQAQQKAGKKFSTTKKVLIGVGVAVAAAAVIFVIARDDLKDDISKW